MKSDGSKVMEASGKAELLRRQFFPIPDAINLEDIADYHYPEPIQFAPISAREITKAITKAAPLSAPGPTDCLIEASEMCYRSSCPHL